MLHYKHQKLRMTRVLGAILLSHCAFAGLAVGVFSLSQSPQSPPATPLAAPATPNSKPEDQVLRLQLSSNEAINISLILKNWQLLLGNRLIVAEPGLDDSIRFLNWPEQGMTWSEFKKILNIYDISVTDETLYGNSGEGVTYLTRVYQSRVLKSSSSLDSEPPVALKVITFSD